MSYNIKVTSDLHGNLPSIDSEISLLLICGDICPAFNHFYSYQKEYMDYDFVKWVNSLQFKDEYSKVVIVFGNHDFYGEEATKEDIESLCVLCNNRLVVLKNELYIHRYMDDGKMKEIKIFGTPYCKIFYDWAFNLSDDKLDAAYDMLPDNTDIFISHDSPTLNGLGTINEGFQKGKDVGNAVLSKYIELRKPRYFFSGHIHSGNHDFTKVGDTYMANVSYKDEKYRVKYQIFEFLYD